MSWTHAYSTSSKPINHTLFLEQVKLSNISQSKNLSYQGAWKHIGSFMKRSIPHLQSLLSGEGGRKIYIGCPKGEGQKEKHCVMVQLHGVIICWLCFPALCLPNSQINIQLYIALPITNSKCVLYYFTDAWWGGGNSNHGSPGLNSRRLNNLRMSKGRKGGHFPFPP